MQINMFILDGDHFVAFTNCLPRKINKTKQKLKIVNKKKINKKVK